MGFFDVAFATSSSPIYNNQHQKSAADAIRIARGFTSRRAKRCKDRADQVESRVNELQKEVDELTLFNLALMRLLTKKELLTREEILKMMHVIDAEDGKLDGKATGAKLREDAPE